MELNLRQDFLLDFVRFAHGQQVRKYTNEPYWTHPYKVAELVAPFDDGTNMLIEIALLHDVLEDTKLTDVDIVNHLLLIGYTMAEARIIERGVIALTDVYTSESFDHMNRKQRKEFEAHRLKKIHWEFQTVKYADLIHNTESIVKHDPNFAKKYLQEKRYILNLMRSGHLDLFVECYKTLIEGESDLELMPF